MTLDKDTILTMTNGGLEVFRQYIPEFIEERKPFLSPLRAEKKPSASIFRSDSGVYLFKDFATGETLNCVDYIIKKENLNFKNAIKKIAMDLKLNLKRDQQVKKNVSLELSSSQLTYFNDYCPQERIGQYLEKYHIFNVSKYSCEGRDYRSKADQPIIGFKIGDDCYKLYQPKKKSGKHMWLGDKTQLSDYRNIWGLDQLPKQCDTILITEGLKDAFVANVNLNHKDIYAVGVDSVHTPIPATTIAELKSRCRNLVVCYDADTAGVGGANRVAQQHNLKVCTLPDVLKEHGGKDISDWFKAGLDIDLLIEAFGNAQVYTSDKEGGSSSDMMDSGLRQMLEMEKVLKDRAKNTVKPEPLITFQGNSVIIKGTINAIIGKQGSHKSRLAAGIASLMCSDRSSIEGGIGFEKVNSSPAHVVYIDTERNTRLEFPPAIGAIQSQSKNENVEEYFHPISVKEFPRENRLGMLKTYIEHLRKETSDHLVVVIDVITDCVNTFNDERETLNLFDYLGKLAEDNDITVIAVIHQNPGSDKARGHVGTELENKCSTAISIGYSNPGDLSRGIITLSYRKNRHSRRLPNLLLKYHEGEQMLMILSEDELKVLKTGKQKADLGDVEAALLKIMPDSGKQYPQRDIVSQLIHSLGCSHNTVKKRLEAIKKKNDGKFEDEDGGVWKFSCQSKNGVKTYYTLSKIETNEE